MDLTLNTGDVALVDDDLRLPSGSFQLTDKGYVGFWLPGHGAYRLHWFVMGGTLAGHEIDHINGDKLDNRRANLRYVTRQRNQVNRKRLNRNNESGVRGVSRSGHASSRPWKASIRVDTKQIHLGFFATVEEAAVARRAAELEYFGELCP